MRQYIDKSKLLEELKRCEKICEDYMSSHKDFVSQGVANAKRAACQHFIKFLNTLEVKEVDFDEEWKNYFKYKGDMATVNVKHLAKHFFELGLFSNLTWQDIRLIAEIGNDFMNSEESDNIELTDEAYYGAILDKVREKGRDAKTSWSENRKAKGEEYSFNIESQLFPTLNAEQQKLWKQEIEQAYMAGSEVNTQDQIDALRMKYEKGRADAISNPTGGELLHVLNKGHKQGYKDAVSKTMNFLWDCGYIDTLVIDEIIDKYKKYMEEQQ